MEFDQVIKRRRSVRKYKNVPVLKEQIMAIIEAGIEAPSWKNSQTARYHVVTSKEILEKLKSCLAKFNFENCKDAPTLIVTTFIKNRAGFERNGTATNELGNGWGCYDLGMHNQNMILKATELNLATLVMGVRDETKIRELLNIDDKEVIVSVIALGIADIEPERPKCKNVMDITKFY